LWSDEEIEATRQEELEQLKEEGPDQDVPGSFGCHELLDRTSLLMNNVSEYVLTHSACVRNKEWYLLAHQAFENLFQLYQDIGAEHIGADERSWKHSKTDY
jgi:hypothetical protein